MKDRNVSVGLFVVSGLVLFGAGMFLIGDRRQAFGQHVEYYSEFVNLAGLSNGAKVRVGGMDAGEVRSIIVPDSPASRFRVKWRIASTLGGVVRTDSVATIDTEGVVGGTFLSVRAGSNQAPKAVALTTIPSKEPAELSELLTRGTAVLRDAETMLKDVGARLPTTLDAVQSTIADVDDIAVGLKQGRGVAGMLLRDDAFAKQLRRTVTTASASVDEILAGLKAGRGTAGMLLRDEVVAAQLRQAMTNAQLATAHLGHAAHQADAMISDLNAQQIPHKAGVAVASLSDTARQANQLISEINQPDRQGLSAGVNIRESLTNANTASLNLADGTEALKHNFLVRGFFKSRGYYNLDHISPEKYRRDSVFTSRDNYRAWLPASELFQDGPNAQEELSAAGKALLSSTLTDSGDSVVISPIVIEGYCGGAEQLLRSRSRAILVRQYLQNHLQLDSSQLGIVPMKNAPPNGMGHAMWDGVCIVVIRRKSK